MTRKEKDAERKRLQRASETPEERESRNEKRRLEARRKRSSESSDASLERLSKQQMIDKTRRNKEAAEQHRLRLDQQQATDTARRSNETAEQHRLRLDQQQAANTTRRSNETVEQHRLRLDQQQATDTARRSNETAEQHRLRLDQQQVTDTTRRNNETAEERTTRVRSISRRRQQRTMETRNNPPEKTWPTSISQKVKENCLSEFNKKMSMNSLREQVCIVCNSRHNETTMHEMLLSDINSILLKPHQSLHETIFDTPPIHSQETNVDGEPVFLNELRKCQTY